MGSRGIVENTVAFPENFFVLTNLDAHGTLQHNIELLAVMGGGVNGFILKFFGILVGNIVGSRQFLTEHRCQILDGDTIFTGSDQALAPAGNSVAGQLGTAAFQQNGDLQTKDLGALVQEGKRQIYGAGFILTVNFFGNLRLFGHLLGAVSQNLAHTSDTGCNVHKLCGRIHVGHSDSPF